MILTGLLVGFYSYMMPGNINLMMIEVQRRKEWTLVLKAYMVVLLSELVYSFVTLKFLSELQSLPTVYSIIEWTSYLLMIALGVWMVMEKKKKDTTNLDGIIQRGMLSAIVHPQQIPFFILVGVMLNEYLEPTWSTFFIFQFALFNTIGAFFMLRIFQLYGQKLLDKMRLNLFLVNRIMGVLYILAALWQMWSLMM